MMDWYADPLWHKLRAMGIGPPDAALTFEQRLAGDNGWSLEFALEVIEEYRRFLYLAAVVREPMTPSVAVDQAWHLHLGYSRHYWDVLCGGILERPLHHCPTEGGPAEAERFRHQYERTLAAYSSVFGTEAPSSIWPDAEARFGARLCSVDRAQVWVVRKVTALWSVAAVATGSALIARVALDIAWLDWLPTAIVYGGLFGLVSVANHRAHRRRRGDCEFELPEIDAGGCGGGCGGCGG
jgi:hypothetical protein